MKKVAVITLHYIRNYGSVLQTYATQYIFEKMGCKVEIIDYVRPNVRHEAIRENRSGMLKKLAYEGWKSIENYFRTRACVSFLEKYVHLTRRYESYQELAARPPQADVYITGSDQTWNSEYNGGILPAYYLDFAPEGCKRIGYSVSIGMDKFPEEEKEQVKAYVEKYNAISVRENQAKTILEEMGYPYVEHVLDPTLMLNRDEWKPLISKDTSRSKYILIHKLNKNPVLEAYARMLAEKTGCKIVRVTYWLSNLFHGGKCFFCPKVGEFLALIDNAEYVLTDSFHCTAFSLNFHKNFFVFYPGKYSGRLQSILKLTGTEHRVVKDMADSPDGIDYSFVDEVLHHERKRVTEFIKENC